MDYDYSSMFAIFGGFIFVLFILGIVLYVISALGLYAMAKKLNIENPWLAWIPVANAYIMGKVAGDQITIFNKEIPKLGLVLLIGAIGMIVISGIPVIGFLACIAYAVISFVTLYKVYRIFAEHSAVLYIILSIVLNVTAPFCIFFASKNEPNMAIFNEGKSNGFSGFSGSGTAQTPVTPYIENPAPAAPVEPAAEPEVTSEPVQPEEQAEEKTEE